MICSSDDEDIFDAEIVDFLEHKIRKPPKYLRERPNHFHLLGDKDFYQRFRLTKESAYCVLELIAPLIKRPTNW